VLGAALECPPDAVVHAAGVAAVLRVRDELRVREGRTDRFGAPVRGRVVDHHELERRVVDALEGAEAGEGVLAPVPREDDRRHAGWISAWQR
jgi:hypothetical protein